MFLDEKMSFHDTRKIANCKNNDIQRKVSWFDKINELTTKKDNSSELKKGEIKKILIQTAEEIMPEFEFLVYKNSCYIFQRLRYTNEQAVYETLHIVFSLKDRNFACSVASSLNPEYIFSKSYNIGLINPHKDLKVLRYNSGTLNIENAYYFHNGRVESTTETVREIFQDYKKYGLPFLDKQLERIKINEIVKVGFAFVNNLSVDVEILKKEIEHELNKGGLLLSNIKHPLFLGLKAKLQSISGQSKEDRQRIPKTAYELLEIYWTR